MDLFRAAEFGNNTRVANYDILFKGDSGKFLDLGVISHWKMSSTGSGSKVSLVIGNAIAEMEKVVHLVNRFGADHDIPQAVINDLNLCLDELLSNTISYGYEDKDTHSIVVNLSLTDGRLIAEIQDDAKPFDPREATPAAFGGTLQLRKIGGLGIHFVKSLMDEVGYRRTGERNVVRIEKKLRGERDDGNR